MTIPFSFSCFNIFSSFYRSSIVFFDRPPPCSRSMSTTTHTLYTIPASDHRFVRVRGEATPVLWRCRPIQTTSQKDTASMPPCRFEIGRCWGLEDIGNSMSQLVWRLRVVDLPEREGFSPAVSVDASGFRVSLSSFIATCLSVSESTSACQGCIHLHNGTLHSHMHSTVRKRAVNIRDIYSLWASFALV